MAFKSLFKSMLILFAAIMLLFSIFVDAQEGSLKHLSFDLLACPSYFWFIQCFPGAVTVSKVMPFMSFFLWIKTQFAERSKYRVANQFNENTPTAEICKGQVRRVFYVCCWRTWWWWKCNAFYREDDCQECETREDWRMFLAAFLFFRQLSRTVLSISINLRSLFI